MLFCKYPPETNESQDLVLLTISAKNEMEPLRYAQYEQNLQKATPYQPYQRRKTQN